MFFPAPAQWTGDPKVLYPRRHQPGRSRLGQRAVTITAAPPLTPIESRMTVTGPDGRA